MTDTTVADGSVLSEAETKYFESGGESELPVENNEAENEGGQQEGQQPEQGEQQPEAKKDKVDLVPHQALHEQRERRKAAEKKARDLEIENAKFRERFTILEKLQGTPRHPAQHDPDAPWDCAADGNGIRHNDGHRHV
jgi:hypothetical protein